MQIAKGEIASLQASGFHSTNFVKFSKNAAFTSYSDACSALALVGHARSNAPHTPSRARKRARHTALLRIFARNAISKFRRHPWESVRQADRIQRGADP